MSFTSLVSKVWGTGPAVDLDFAYDLQRSGANMQYKVKITVNTLRTSSAYFGYPIYADISLAGSAKVSGYTLKSASPSTWSSDIVYTSDWFTVSNKTSGTTSLKIRIYSGLGNTRDATYTFDLPVSPAMSSITASDGTLDTTQVLTVTQYNSTFTHTVTYACGSASGTIVTKSNDTSINWTPPLDLAQQNTTGNSVSIKLTIETYDGGTSVGSAFTTITAAIPAKVKPTATLTLSDPTGALETYGGYVQGHSQLAAVLTGTGSHGSVIKGHQINVGDKSYYFSSSKTVELPNSGSLTVTGLVTDSRIRMGKVSKTITVLAYKVPKISKFIVSRCAEDGTNQPDGAFVKATFTASISTLNRKNSAKYEVQYRKEGTEKWSTISVDDAAGDWEATDVSVVFAASTDSAFEVRVAAIDDFQPIYSSLRTVTIAFTLMQADTTGTGLAVGQQAIEPNTFAVGIPMQINAGISKVALDKATSSRLALGIGKQLWAAGDGNKWSSNHPTLEIEEIQNYTMFYVGLEEHATNILVIRDGNYFRGTGAYDHGDAQQIYTINAMIAGTTLTLESLRYARHFYSGSVGEAVAVEANCIYGIF